MKKISIIFLRIVSIIDMLGIMLISFLCLGGLFTCIILCILFALIQSDFNKIVDKLGIRKLSIILLSPLILLLLIVILSNVQNRITTVSEWLKVKNDFEIVNEIVINYYDENKDNKNIVKNSSYRNEKYIYIEFKEFEKIRLLSNEELRSLNEIEKYYKQVSKLKDDEMCVYITKDYIAYNVSSDVKFYEIVFFRNKINRNKINSSLISERDLEHIIGNWYKTRPEFHIID